MHDSTVVRPISGDSTVVYTTSDVNGNSSTVIGSDTTIVIEQGSRGLTGPLATITVGTTTTGLIGTPASVTNSGTSSAAVFDFTIPAGIGVLNDLSDVVITSPYEYQTLAYNGTNWVNDDAASISFVHNAETTTLTAGTAVYLYQQTGDRASVKRAYNTSDATSAKTLGIVAEDIAVGGDGPVVTQGYVHDINLNMFTAGQTLYLGATAGTMTATKPYAPNHLVYLGVVVRANAGNGIMYVRAQNGYELDEIHDVDLTTNPPTSGQFLKYNGSLWVADAIDLGTDTTGDYVGTITAGTGVTTSGASTGEGIAHSISIGQSVATSATPTFAGGVFTGSSSGDLVRITQTGTGNALLVEDNTNPDATYFAITNVGDMQVGTANNFGKVNIASTLAIHAATPLLNFVNTSNTRIGYLYHDATNISLLNQVAGYVSFGTNNTERMRIDSSGQVGIGATPSAGRTLTVTKTITGATSTFGILNNGVVQSDVTSSAVYYRSGANTAAAAFTLTSLWHFGAVQGTFGATSAVTTQAGFVVDSSLTGATNNYGFWGAIASGTGRYNLYMNGTADNYLAGRLGVGATLTSGAMAQVVNTTAADKAFIVKGAASQSGDFIDVQNSAGTSQFKIASTGEVLINQTSRQQYNHFTDAINFQILTTSSGGIQIANFAANQFGGSVLLTKSRGTTGVNTIVQNGDTLGNLQFIGADGTNYVRGATIEARVDGTPGTNDMPSRLMFSTTADGASTPTERMRIDSSGNVGIGTTTPSSYGLLAVGASISASATTNMIGMYQSAGVDSATMRIAGYAYTGNARTAIDFVQNGATNFNSQMVFSTSAGADAVERMRITGGGNVGIGVTPTSMLHVVNTTAANKALVVKGAASQSGSLFEIQNSASTALVTVDSSGNVGIGTASPFSSAGYGALTVEGTGGHIISGKIAGTETFRLQTTTLSTTINVIAAVPLILNTSNTERMRITSGGNIGIGNSGGGDTNLSIGSNITGATTAYGIRSLQTIQSGVTGTALIFQSQPSTVASAFTLSSLHHFTASGVTVGAGSVVTEQNAFLVESTMTGATNNYGFRGSIASGTGRYNIYMGGTAQNYLAGNTGIGVTVPTSKLHVVGSFSRGAPVTKTGSFTLADTENWVICNGTASITVTLPAASTQVGREISLKNIAAFTVVSASSNVVPLTGGAAGTAILAATAGTWAKLVSDGANWQIMQS